MQRTGLGAHFILLIPSAPEKMPVGPQRDRVEYRDITSEGLLRASSFNKRNWPLVVAFSLREHAMTDNLTNCVQPDRSKIRDQLQKAVDKVGNSAAAVRKELGLK